MSTRHEIKSHGTYRGVILSRNTFARLVQMPWKKKNRSGRVRFRVQRQGGRGRKTRLARIGLKN